MYEARVPKIGDVVGVLGHSGTFWVSSMLETGHTAVLRLIGREDYTERGISWGVLTYLEDNGETQVLLNASLARIRNMAKMSRERHEYQLQALSNIEGAAFISGNVQTPRETMAMPHRQLAAEALVEFNELTGILQARS